MTPPLELSTYLPTGSARQWPSVARLPRILRLARSPSQHEPDPLTTPRWCVTMLPPRDQPTHIGTYGCRTGRKRPLWWGNYSRDGFNATPHRFRTRSLAAARRDLVSGRASSASRPRNTPSRSSCESVSGPGGAQRCCERVLPLSACRVGTDHHGFAGRANGVLQDHDADSGAPEASLVEFLEVRVNVVAEGACDEWSR